MLSLCLAACTKQQSFKQAIAAHKNSLVDQVNTVGRGAPYFTVKTLNPVWQLTSQTRIVTIPNFELQDQDGRPRDASLFKEHVSIVGFFFASCSGFCPFLVESMKSVERDLHNANSSVQFVAISVNPEKDTPEKLTVYAKDHQLNTQSHRTLLTGDHQTIYDLAKHTFASQVFQRPIKETSFVHSEHLYVIDQAGRLRGILNGTRVDLKRDARALIAELPENTGKIAKRVR